MTARRYNLTLHLLVLAALAGSILALAQAAFSTVASWRCTAQPAPAEQIIHSTGFEASARDGAVRERH